MPRALSFPCSYHYHLMTRPLTKPRVWQIVINRSLAARVYAFQFTNRFIMFFGYNKVECWILSHRSKWFESLICSGTDCFGLTISSKRKKSARFIIINYHCLLYTEWPINYVPHSEVSTGSSQYQRFVYYAVRPAIQGKEVLLHKRVH